MRQMPNVLELQVNVTMEPDETYRAVCPRWPWLKARGSTAGEAEASLHRDLVQLRLARWMPYAVA